MKRGDGRRLAVVGAGWAGLAAATELQLAGHDVTVYESAHEVGGRARRVAAPSPDAITGAGFDAPLDNGQHLLLGAYTDTLALMRKLGIAADEVLLRTPLRLSSVDGGFDLRAPRWIAPLHALAALLGARGLGARDKKAAVGLMLALRRRRFQTRPGATVAQLLDDHLQPDSVVRSLWQPLCLAALNTPIDAACAQLFATVLRDSLAHRRSDSDLLIPRTDLTALWPAAAARHCWMRHGHPVRAVAPDGDGVLVDGERYAGAVLATPPYATARLLPTDAQADALRGMLQAFRYLPIATLTVTLAAPYRLPQPMMMLFDDPARGHHGQWVFDRGALLGLDPAQGELAIVASAASALTDQPRADTIAALIAQLTEQAARARNRHRGRLPPLPAALAAELIVEKRATFAAVPGLARPSNATPWPRLMLAGDWTDTGYPATLEGAVRSGNGAAARLIRQFNDEDRGH